MESYKPSRLTENALADMKKPITAASKFKTTILQVIEKLESCSIILSDGEFKGLFKYSKDHNPLVNTINQNDVVACIATSLGDNFGLLRVSVVYTGLKKVIGAPLTFGSVDLDKYFKSPAVSHDIPNKFWASEQSLDDHQDLSVVEKNAPMVPFQKKKLLSSLDDFKPENVTPLANLTFGSVGWASLVRVDFKSNIYNWEGGKMFKVLIFDASDALELCFYNEQCEKYYNSVQEGQVYILTQARITKSSVYNMTSRSHELQMQPSSKFILHEKMNEVLPKHMKLLSSMEDLKDPKATTKNTFSLIGIVVNLYDKVTRESKKTNRPYTLRHLQIVDQSKTVVTVTVWGDLPGEEHLRQGETLIFKHFKKIDFAGGIQLSSSNCSKIATAESYENNPVFLEISKAFILYKDIENEKIPATEIDKSSGEKKKVFNNLSLGTQKRKVETISQVQKNCEILLLNKEAKVFPSVVFGFVESFGNHIYYDSCGIDSTCYKKVIQDEEGNYMCPVHGKFKPEEKPIPRYIGTVVIKDSFTSHRMTFSSEAVGSTLFDLSAEQMRQKILTSDELSKKAYFESRKNRFYKFELIPRVTVYNDEEQLKFYIKSIETLELDECYDESMQLTVKNCYLEKDNNQAREMVDNLKQYQEELKGLGKRSQDPNIIDEIEMMQRIEEEAVFSTKQLKQSNY